MPNMPKIGVEAVVGNLPAFQKGIASIHNQVAKASAGLVSAASSTNALDKAFGALQFGTGVAGAALGTMALVATAAATAIAGAAGMIAGAVSLGIKGAVVKGVEESFDKLTASINITAGAMLGDLRTAAKGTISDFDLMKQSNIALAGATGEFATLFAQKLPKLLEIARVQARATGQDINYLFESLVTGVKRASPLMIDNTGLTIKIGEANAAYAAAIGKTVEQMTLQEQQIALLNAVMESGEVAIQTLGNANLSASDQMSQLNATLANIGNNIASAFEPAVARFLGALNAILEAAAPWIEALGEIFAQAFDAIFGPISAAVNAVNAAQFAKGFFTGGARMISALAAGILSAASAVARAVRVIADIIASFLVGASPPPEGPLSRIDQGGANVMSAWLDGFMGVGLEPLALVAAEVAGYMGSIATASREQVEKRLKGLDAALAPFSNRVKILRAEFDALKGPVDAAFNAIDRQLEKAVQALANGDANAAALVRSLDAQRDALEGYVDTQQTAIDNAELQLALAKAQQAKERALLEIRKDQLGPAPREESQGSGSGGGAASPKPKGGGGGGGAPAPAGGGGGYGGGSDSSRDPMGGGQREGYDYGGALGDAFNEGGAPGAAKGLQGEIEGIKSAFGKIGSANIGDKIKKPFEDAFRDIKKFFDDFILDLPNFPQRVADGLANLWNTLNIQVFQPVTAGISSWVAQQFDPASATGIVGKFRSLAADIIAQAGDVWATLDESIFNPIRTGINTWIANITNPANAGSIPYEFLQLVTTHIPSVLSEWGAVIQKNLVQPAIDKVNEIAGNLYDFFGSGNEGSVSWILDKAVEFFAALPQRIGDALKAIGSFVINAFVKPIVNAINTVIQAFQDFINDVIIPGLKGIPGLNLQINPVNFGTINTDTGGGGTFGAKGGLFSRGLMTVGERGPEYLASGSSKLGVFPNRFVRSLDRLSSVMTAQPAPVMVPGGNNTNNYYDNSGGNITANFNGSDRRHEMMRMLGTFRASRR